MGNKPPTKYKLKASASSIDLATERAQSRAGRVTVTGRFNRRPKRLDDDYTILRDEVLGSGYNGSVLKATRGDHKFAVKALRLSGVSEDVRAQLETECEIFLGMDHPHVARLVDVYESKDRLDLVMECMEGGELFDRVREQRRFSEKDAAHAAYQMLLAINYIHSRKVVHRDLKLENFMYEKKDTDHLKLIDFGFGKIWSPDTVMRSTCGTLSYVAPEVLKGEYGMQCDIWSLGVVIFIMLVGYMPFKGDEEKVMKQISSGQCIWNKKAWSKVSETGISFVKSLLVVNASSRLTAEQALAHEWIAQREGHAGHDGLVDQEVVNALCRFAEASNFKRACMSLMAWSLSCEERAAVRDAFIEMDTSRRGTITLKEFQHVLSTRFKIEDVAAQRIFAALDTSGDQEIQYTEFLAAMVNTRIAVHDDLLMRTFHRFDVDNTGVISIANLKVVLGEQFNGEQVEQLLREADINGDGEISCEEFMGFLKGGGASNVHLEAAEKLIEAQISASRQNSGVDVQESGGAGGDVEVPLAPPVAEQTTPPPPPCPPAAQNAKSRSCSIL
eukprot:TRINITY_DN47174_c0_g1_i1.p1 TRINITY_DN47174_c0_g1~~TRINITY_DN47174_c0_g1_i1.p1  ORF type:complete len:558 (-),score=122.34 TRINITY_DN47174_c0_g1_i1:50-1723(-)